MAVKNHSCAADDGCCDVRNMLREYTFQEHRILYIILYIHLDYNKIYVTKLYGTTDFKFIWW
jgi:hypothetical protein